MTIIGMENILVLQTTKERIANLKMSELSQTEINKIIEGLDSLRYLDDIAGELHAMKKILQKIADNIEFVDSTEDS